MTSSVALAQWGQLYNGGFELGETAKTTNGFATLGGPQDAWANDGLTYTNTGVENANAYDGTWRVFEMAGDNGCYQMTDGNPGSYNMTPGDQITLIWWAIASNDPSTGNTNPPVSVVSLISCTPANFGGLANGSLAGTTTLITTNIALPGIWTEYTLTYTANGGDNGNNVGVDFYTTNLYGLVTNSFGAYDDFELVVLPAGSIPEILTQPVGATAYTGASVSLTVAAAGATSYQWMAGATGSHTYTNLLNAGIFSGVNTPTLTLTNVQPTNSGDYVVVASNGSGSVTSSVANITVATIIYQETFTVPVDVNQSITNVGWINELCGGFGHDSRIFSGPTNGNPQNGVSWPASAVYSFNTGQSNCNGAFYFTTATANGGPYDVRSGDGAGPITGKLAFPGINLSFAQNLSFSIAGNNGGGANQPIYWAVQMNHGQWYVSTNFFTDTGSTFQTFSWKFSNLASAWNLLTVSGHDVVLNGTNVVIGGPAGANLTGYITGAGIVSHWITSGGNFQFNNYKVLGAIPPSIYPVINSPPFTSTNYTGNTQMFTVAATTNTLTTGLTYQWYSSPVGLGTFTPLSNVGQYSGVTNTTLVISNVTAGADHLDYEVIVSDGAGSVTSTPPATLWVVDSVPIISSDTTIYPDNCPDLGGSPWVIHTGNNNVMNFTASFVGNLPTSYQWQYSPTNTGASVTSILNATNSAYALSNPTTNASGYYRLTATNSQSGGILSTSTWVQLTVLSNAPLQWSAKVPFTGLTASNILFGVPGTYFEAETFGLSSNVTVTEGGTNFLFDSTGGSATEANGYTRWSSQYNGTTGDPNMDTVLGSTFEGVGTITLNNLTVGTNYSVQLFAFDDNEGPSRQGNFITSTNDTSDVSPSFNMGDNVYLVGTFMATNTTQTVILNGDAGLYMSCLVVRYAAAASPKATLGILKVGSTLQVGYTNGILEQATNVQGPWTTNSTPSPYTFTPTSNGPAMFFRALSTP